MVDLTAVWAECDRQGLDIEDRRDELSIFVESLYEVNKVRNLTRVSPEDAALRHIVDSLLVVPFIPDGSHVLDVGCGPGFPAWVIAWARPDVSVLALDSNSKMQWFLSQHSRVNLGQRIQRAEEDILRDQFDVVTGRALAPFGIQAEVSAAWLTVGGIFIPFRTEAERAEIESANLGMLGLKLREMNKVELPDGAGTRLFPVWEKVKPTPIEYPRSWAKIKAKPLGVRSAR
jgi:16S rRNA (guanine527-N7)-methyltransferase